MNSYNEGIENIKTTFQQLKFNKLIVVGTGSLYREINSILQFEKIISLFLETGQNKSHYFGKPVTNLKEFFDNEKLNNQYLILICTSMWTELEETLNLKQKTNLSQAQIFNPYKNYKWQLELKNLPIYILEKNMYSFIDCVDQKDFSMVHKETINIFFSEWAGKAMPYQLIAMAILLRARGYNVTILYNDCSEYGDWEKGNGFSNYNHQIYTKLLHSIETKFSIKIFMLSESTLIKMNAFEEDLFERYLYYYYVWHTKKYVIDKEDIFYQKIKTSLKRTIMLIKGYYTENQCDKALIWTGIHNYYAMVNIILTSMKKYFYTWDYINRGYKFTKNSPTVFLKDRTLFKDRYLKKEQQTKLRQDILAVGKRNFDKNAKFNGYTIYPNSAVIPLNVFWDSAAYTNGDLFIDYYEWLRQTIKFIIETCNAHVYIRQHPYEKRFNSGHDLKKALEDEFGENPLYHFIDAYSEISTYDLLKGAKVILPNTSTVGIEAAILGKPIILKNDVYYSDEKFAIRAYSIEEYFYQIKKMLNIEEKICSAKQEEAYLVYGLIFLDDINKEFGHFYPEVQDWLKKDIYQLLEMEAVKAFFSLIEEDRTILENMLLER